MASHDAPRRRLATLARQVLPSSAAEEQQQQQQQCRPPAAEAPALEALSLSPCSSARSNDRLLAGQVAIITGSGKGIGEAAAKLLAAHGAAVVVSDLDEKAAQAVAAAIQRAGGQAIAVAADVTAPDTPSKLVQAAAKAFGGLHILVNNAGFTWDGVIHKMTPDQWDVMLAVHCTAPFRLIQAAAPFMRDAAREEMDRTGRAAPRCIINVSSTSGTHGNAGQANYATAKAGVVGLTKAVAKEWGAFNIRCNALAFGLIDTRLTRAKEGGESIQVGGKQVALGIPQANQQFDSMKASIPLRRMGTADEAAGAVLLLASPWASYVTGQVLEVNGGSYM